MVSKFKNLRYGKNLSFLLITPFPEATEQLKLPPRSTLSQSIPFSLFCFMGSRKFKFNSIISTVHCSALCNIHLQELQTGTQDYFLVFWSHSLPNSKTIDTPSSHLNLNSILFYSAVQIPEYVLDANCMQEFWITNISPLFAIYFPQGLKQFSSSFHDFPEFRQPNKNSMFMSNRNFRVLNTFKTSFTGVKSVTGD